MYRNINLSDAELVLMNILWSNGSLEARTIAVLANKETGWEKNTVYTMIRRLIDKGAIIRSEPDFICTASVIKSDVGRQQTKRLLDKMYNGSAKLFLRAFIREQSLSEQELEELKCLIDEEK